VHSSTGVSNHESQAFRDTDTLYLEFRAGDIVETRDDENTPLDLDA